MDARTSRPQRDDLRFCRAFFEVLEPAAIDSLLRDVGAIEMSDGPGESERWYWWGGPRASGGDASFILRVRARRLVLEGPTPGSIGDAWRELDRSLAPAARARVAAGDDLSRFLPRPRRHTADRPETWAPEHERRVLQEFYAAFCQRWANAPHRRLDGRSPRQAVGEPDLEAALEDLLARMEHLEQERVSRGLQSFSATDLRRAVFSALPELEA